MDLCDASGPLGSGMGEVCVYHKVLKSKSVDEPNILRMVLLGFSLHNNYRDINTIEMFRRLIETIY